MDTTTCSNCSGAVEFDAQTAISALARRHDAAMDVMARFMEVSAGQAGALSAEQQVHIARLLREVKRIVGGQPTSNYPECALIGHRSTNGAIGWFCSGVLVHPQIVLTAGHCFVPDNRANVIALGADNQNALQHAELINIRRLAVNPAYAHPTPFSDITVIILRTPALTTPVALATAAEFAAESKVTLVGFGNNDANQNQGFGVKREVDVDVISRRTAPEQALDEDEQRYGYESDFEFVAGGAGFDSCNGDSGGPVYIHNAAGKKLVGLTSRATNQAAHACGDGGIYTRVDAQLAYVKAVALAAGVTDFG